jgi:thioesterase domain-containing protein
VLMIDAMMPGHTPYLHPRDGLPALLDSYIGEFLMSPPAALGRWLQESWTRLRALTRRESRSARRTGRLRKINMAATAAYQPEPFEGRLTMLMCSEASFRAYQDLRLGWSSVARGGLEVHVIPGNHSTMEQEPNIQVLARCVRTSMDRIEKSSPRHALVPRRRLAGPAESKAHSNAS